MQKTQISSFRRTLLPIVVGSAALWAFACGGSDPTTPASGEGSAKGGNSSSSSSSSASGGSSSSSSGSKGGSSSSSSSSSASSNYWPGTYDSSGKPEKPGTVTTYHATNPGACLAKGCHGSDGSAQLKIVWGGVVFQSDGKTPAGNVQVGVVEGSYKTFVYSASNGLYWAEGTQTLKWDQSTDIRIRNGKGEVPKLPEHTRGADCDSCHIASVLPLKTLP